MGNREKGAGEIHSIKEVRVFKWVVIYIYSIISVLSHIYCSFKDAGTLLMFISSLSIHNLNP